MELVAESLLQQSVKWLCFVPDFPKKAIFVSKGRGKPFRQATLPRARRCCPSGTQIVVPDNAAKDVIAKDASGSAIQTVQQLPCLLGRGSVDCQGETRSVCLDEQAEIVSYPFL